MKNLVAIIFIFITVCVKAQELLPLQSNFIIAIDKWKLEQGKNDPSFLKPYILDKSDTLLPVDSLLSFNIHSKHTTNYISRKWTYEPLFKVDEKYFSINIDPLFDFSYFHDRADGLNYYTNSRGLRLMGNIENEVFFESSFIENQASFPLYLTDYIHMSSIVPGQGQARRYEEGFDYSIASGSLSFKIKKRYFLSFGHGKFMAGDGYRSLLLSENSFNFPFIRFSSTFGNFTYTRIMSILMSDTLPYEAFEVRGKRLAGFNILTFNPGKTLQISLFEGNVWEYPNSVRNVSVDYNYYNPVILFNSVAYRKNHTSLVGMGAKVNLLKSMILYGQFALDNSTGNNYKLANRTAFQGGLKIINIPFARNLFFQVEYNIGNHAFNKITNDKYSYSHYNQSITHPLGNNFRELVINSSYTFRRWYIFMNYQKASYGYENAPEPLNISRYAKTFFYQTPFPGEGEKTLVTNWNGGVCYVLNAFSRRVAEFGFRSRNAFVYNNNFKNEIFYISFKTHLFSNFYDF